MTEARDALEALKDHGDLCPECKHHRKEHEYTEVTERVNINGGHDMRTVMGPCWQCGCVGLGHE